MDKSILFIIGLQIALIALNAVFACAEIAVISMNDTKLAKMAAEGDKRAVRLARLTSQPARFLATIQVAITLSGFLGSAFAAENFSGLLTDWLLGLGVPMTREVLNSAASILNVACQRRAKSSICAREATRLSLIMMLRCGTSSNRHASWCRRCVVCLLAGLRKARFLTVA